MGYQYKIIVYNRNVYKEYEIAENAREIRIGTTQNCELRLDSSDFFETVEIFLVKNDRWNLSCGDNLYISRGDAIKHYSTQLEHDDNVDIYYDKSSEIALSCRFLIDFEATPSNFAWGIDLGTNRFRIGSRADSDIVLESSFGSNADIEIVKSGENIELREIESQHGVYVNGKRIYKTAILENHDFFSVGDFFAYLKDERLYFDKKNVRVNRVEMSVSKLEADTSYPKFVRNTRIKSQCNKTPIKVLDPSNIPQKPEINYVMSLMPAIVMFALVVILRGILNSTGGTFVLFSICSMGLGVITSIASIIDKKKKYKLDCQKRSETYENYIKNKRIEIEEAREQERNCLENQYYSTEQDLRHIDEFSTDLFDRTVDDDDFLDVYLGVGTTNALRKIDYKIQEKLETGDELSLVPSQIALEYKYLDNAPVVLKLKDANAVGIVGNQLQLYEIFKSILIDLVTRQYYGDLNLFLILGDDYKQYDWIRKLPNLQNAKKARNIVCDNESKNNIFEELYKDLNNRVEKKVTLGYNVILVKADQGIKRHPLSRFIENASTLNTVFIFFEEKENLLPLHCKRIVTIRDNNRGVLFETENRGEGKEFQYKCVSDEQILRAMNILAPIYCEEISLEGSLRKNISLYELLGIYRAQDLDLRNRWEKSRIYDSMAAPLGINAKNEIVFLDLHEKYHGPHGLVAGTTGSGKSEILQTYILAASTLFHPYEIGFVIIDFKGGGMVNQFKDLPHLIGAITNIDGKAIDRSLKSIRAELLKRQTLFAEIGVNHIDKYIKAFKEGIATVALPHLVIIVDEFAELKAEQPEFMKELISTARIGRSLGVHLILATQKPAGQVNDQIWSNSKFKLCLKVQTKEDSNEVLHSPLAAEILEPGRAYLQVGNNELFELLQSGYSGSPETIETGENNSFEIFEIDFKGNRNAVFRQKSKRSQNNRTQLEALVKYLHDYCNDNEISSLPPICLPDLPKKLDYTVEGIQEQSTEVNVTIGTYDDPDHQYQGNITIPISASNIMIIGSAQYGKTNLVEVILRDLAEKYTAAEVNMYIIDFGSMVLKNFENLAHVGGVVCPADDEKLKNLFKYLNDQILYRRELLLSMSVSSFTAYREAGYKEIPLIVVFVDNFATLRELYLQDNDELLRLCREGIGVGISFVVTNMQTSGLGYRYLSNFSTRVALFNNEPGEYTSLFGTCRVRPDEIQGRCLIEIEKTIYEGQTYLAFNGEREFERIQFMKEFISEVNGKNASCRAIPIPEIPDMLGENYVYDHFSTIGNQVFIGLDYSSIGPVWLDMEKANFIAISGASNSGKSNFVRFFAHAIAHYSKVSQAYIFDDYRKKLRGLEDISENCLYETEATHCKEAFKNLDLLLQMEYQMLINGQKTEFSPIILILNNEDVIKEISNDKETMDTIKNIVGKFKPLNVFVIVACVPNAPIVYGSHEVYKLVKETRNLLFFDNIDMCKVLDVPLSFVRQNKKRINVGDAFYLCGTDCSKIKTPLAIN